MAKRPLHRRPWVWAILVVMLSGIAFALVHARGPRVPVTSVTRRDLEQHLVASGRVLAPARIDVASQTVGVVVAVGVREGDRVKPGDLLVQLDDAEMRAAVAQAAAAVAQASARADQVHRVAAVVTSGALVQAKANLDNAEQQFERTRALVASGSLPQKELDDAHRALDVARAQRDAADAEQLGSAPRGVEARSALAALSLAEAQLASAKVRLAQTRIVAVAEAVVLTRDVEPGVVVQPARTLLTLSTVGDTRLVLQPDERDLAFVQVGQKARASADAFPSDAFDAEVAYVAPSIDPQRGTVEVRLKVPSPPAYLRPDMTVSVDLTVARKSDALVVRSEAVRGFATPTPWALAVVADHAERRALRLGIRGDGMSEVLQGLAPGDLVIVPDGQAVLPGQRVRTIVEER